jgi:hypothetical protein
VSDREARSGPLPWATVFDPAANARALGEIQARGLRAASELVDRLVEAVDGRRHPDGDGDPSTAGTADPSAAPGADQLVQLWSELLRRGVEAVRGIAGASGSESPVDVTSGAITIVQLEADRGAQAGVVLRLSGGGDGPMEGVALQSTDLVAPDGGVVSAASVRFDPSVVDLLPGTPVEIAVQVDIPGDCAAGRYRGTISSTRAPDLWMPVEVVVG